MTYIVKILFRKINN